MGWHGSKDSSATQVNKRRENNYYIQNNFETSFRGDGGNQGVEYSVVVPEGDKQIMTVGIKPEAKIPSILKSIAKTSYGAHLKKCLKNGKSRKTKPMPESLMKVAAKKNKVDFEDISEQSQDRKSANLYEKAGIWISDTYDFDSRDKKFIEQVETNSYHLNTLFYLQVYINS